MNKFENKINKVEIKRLLKFLRVREKNQKRSI